MSSLVISARGCLYNVFRFERLIDRVNQVAAFDFHWKRMGPWR